MALITYPLDNIDYSADDAELYLCTRTSGVFAQEDNLRVYASSGLEVNVAPGIAWIKNSDFSGKVVASKEHVSVTIPTPNAGLPRIDRIVIGFDSALNESTIYAGVSLNRNTQNASLLYVN